MKQIDNEAEDFDLEEYDFSPLETVENGNNISDYTGVESNKVYLVNKKDILTKPRPKWIPELDDEGLMNDSYLPVTVHDDMGNYYLQGKIKTGEHEKTLNNYLHTKVKIPEFKTRIYKMKLDVLAGTVDYYIKKKKAQLKEAGLSTAKIGLPRSLSRMSTSRYQDMVNLLKFCKNYQDSPDENIKKAISTVLKPSRYSELYNVQNNIVFREQYIPLLQELKDKKLDLNLQKSDYINTHEKGQITAYGDVNSVDVLRNSHGLKVKKQNGKKLSESDILNISKTVDKVWSHYGNLSELAREYDLKLSYADNCNQHASKYSGIFTPYFKTIGVSFYDMTDRHKERSVPDAILAHETAHWLDSLKGQEHHSWFASDIDGTPEREIAVKYKNTLRNLIDKQNEQKLFTSEKLHLGEYWFRSCECFARALEQDYAIKHGIKIDELGYLPEDVYRKEIQPLVEALNKSNRIHFNLTEFRTIDSEAEKSMETPASEQGIEESPYEINDVTGLHKVWKLYGENELSRFLDNPNPSAENISEFNKWLKEHKDDYVRLYHGTSSTNPIKEQGIKTTTATRRKSYQSESGYVYLSRFPTMAKAFGEMNNPGKTSVYSVDLKISELKSDLDQLKNKRMAGYESDDESLKNIGTTLAESLIYGSGARIKRSIKPYELKEISFTDEKENKNMNTSKKEKITYFVKDTAELEMFSRFEPITGLSAEEAVSKLIEMKNKDYDCGIGIHIPGDFIFDDSDGDGAVVFTSMPEIHKFSFYMGNSFVTGLKERNEHSENVIQAFKSLDAVIRNSGIYKDKLYDEPAFLYEKEKELGLAEEKKKPAVSKNKDGFEQLLKKYPHYEREWNEVLSLNKDFTKAIDDLFDSLPGIKNDEYKKCKAKKDIITNLEGYRRFLNKHVVGYADAMADFPEELAKMTDYYASWDSTKNLKVTDLKTLYKEYKGSLNTIETGIMENIERNEKFFNEPIPVTDEIWNALSSLADKAKMDWFYEETYESKTLTRQILDDLSTAFDSETQKELSAYYLKLVIDYYKENLPSTAYKYKLDDFLPVVPWQKFPLYSRQDKDGTYNAVYDEEVEYVNVSTPLTGKLNTLYKKEIGENSNGEKFYSLSEDSSGENPLPGLEKATLKEIESFLYDSNLLVENKEQDKSRKTEMKLTSALSENGRFVLAGASNGMLSKYINRSEITEIEDFRKYAAEKIEGSTKDKSYFAQMWLLGQEWCKEKSLPLPELEADVQEEIENFRNRADEKTPVVPSMKDFIIDSIQTRFAQIDSGTIKGIELKLEENLDDKKWGGKDFAAYTHFMKEIVNSIDSSAASSSSWYNNPDKILKDFFDENIKNVDATNSLDMFKEMVSNMREAVGNEKILTSYADKTIEELLKGTRKKSYPAYEVVFHNKKSNQYFEIKYENEIDFEGGHYVVTQYDENRKPLQDLEENNNFWGKTPAEIIESIHRHYDGFALDDCELVAPSVIRELHENNKSYTEEVKKIVKNPKSVELINNDIKSDEVAILFNYEISKSDLHKLFYVAETTEKHLQDKEDSIKLEFKVSQGGITSVYATAAKDGKIYNFNLTNSYSVSNSQLINSLLKEHFSSINNDIGYDQEGWNSEWHKIHSQNNEMNKENNMENKQMPENKELDSVPEKRCFTVDYKQKAIDRMEFNDSLDEKRKYDFPSVLQQNNLEIEQFIFEGRGFLNTVYESFICSKKDNSGFNYILYPHNPEYYKNEDKLVVSESFASLEEAKKACIETMLDSKNPEIRDYEIVTSYGNLTAMPEKVKSTILDYFVSNDKDVCQKAEEYCKEKNYSYTDIREKVKVFLIQSDEYDFNNEEWAKKIDLLQKNEGLPLFSQENIIIPKEVTKDTRIKDWYMETYPTDTHMFDEIDENATFAALELAVEEDRYQWNPRYDYGDSVVRERIFTKISELNDEPYKVIYDKWMNGKGLNDPRYTVDWDGNRVLMPEPKEQLRLNMMEILGQLQNNYQPGSDANEPLLTVEQARNYVLEQCYDILAERDGLSQKDGICAYLRQLGDYTTLNILDEAIIKTSSLDPQFLLPGEIKRIEDLNSILKDEAVIKVYDHGSVSFWSDRNQAEKFYQNGIMGTEGAESESYKNIYEDLKAGKNLCCDETPFYSAYPDLLARKELNPVILSCDKEMNVIRLPYDETKIVQNLEASLKPVLEESMKAIEKAAEDFHEKDAGMKEQNKTINLGDFKNVIKSTPIIPPVEPSKEMARTPFEIINNEEKGRVNIKFNPLNKNPYFNEIIKELRKNGWKYAPSTKQWYPLKVEGSSEYAASLFETYKEKLNDTAKQLEKNITLDAEKEKKISVSSESVIENTNIQNTSYSGIKFFDRNYSEPKDFMSYFNENLGSLGTERPISIKESETILVALNHLDSGVIESRTERLGLDENNNLIIFFKNKDLIEKKQITLSELVSHAYDKAKETVSLSERKIKEFSDDSHSPKIAKDMDSLFLGLYMECYENGKKVLSGMEKLYETYGKSPAQSIEERKTEKDLFLEEQEQKRKNLEEQKLPYVEIPFIEGDGSVIKRGTVWTLQEADRLIPEMNEKFKEKEGSSGYYKMDVKIHFPEKSDDDGEPVVYSFTMDMATDNKQESLSEYIRMMCSYPEVLELYEKNWKKVFTPEVTEKFEKNLDALITKEEKQLKDRFEHKKFDLKESMGSLKDLHSSFIIDADKADKAKKSVTESQEGIKRLFDRKINQTLTEVFDYLGDMKKLYDDMGFKYDHEQYEVSALHKVKNMLQDIKYGESRNQHYPYDGFDFDLWRKSLEKVIDAADYDGYIKDFKSSYNQSLEQIMSAKEDLGLNQTPARKLTTFGSIPAYAIPYMMYGESDGLEKEDIEQIDRFMKENKLARLVDVDDAEPSFTSRPDFGLATDCVKATFETITFTQKKEKTSKIKPLELGDKLGQDEVMALYDISDGVYQATLACDNGNGSFSAESYFVVDRNIAEKLSPEIKGLMHIYGNRFVIETKRNEPYVLKSLIEKNLIPPRDEEFVEKLNSYIEKYPLKYAKLFPVSAQNFEQRLREIALIEKDSNRSAFDLGQTLISMTEKNEKKALTEWLRDQKGCKDKESMKKVFESWIGSKEQKKEQQFPKQKKNSGYPPRGE